MILYGRPVAMPQGEEWMQWGSPHIIDVLFSVKHGLVSWTPVCGLALAGLWPLYKKDRVLGAACAAAFGVSLYANAAVIEWWAGEAYGLRRFVSCFPIFALGAAALIDRLSARPALVVSAISLIVIANFVLLVHYQAFMHGIRTNLPYPEHVLSSPLHLLRWVRSL
jgi:predicted lysophospholipase L1 biosynthesis ABC-type transport system permease subunit